MKLFYVHRKYKKRNERGTIIALAAVSSVALVLAAALSIDISHLYLAGGELQNAADAAALSAASALNSSSEGITKAVDRAVASVNKYDLNKNTLTFRRENVRFAVNLSEFDNGGTGRSETTAAATPQDIRFVKVEVPPTAIPLFFANQVLGGDTFNISRSAVAGQSLGLNLICNIAPLSVLEDPETSAPLDVDEACPDKTQFTPGCLYTVRGAPGNSVAAGNYLLLALDNERGGSNIREKLAIGSTQCYSPGQTVPTEPGVKAGPVRQGLNTRFDEYTGTLEPGDYPPDANIKTGITYAQYTSGLTMYQREPRNEGIPNRRVLVIPIVKENEYDGGRDIVTINRFGAFFMQDMVGNGDGGDIKMEFISSRIVMGDGGYLAGGGNGNARFTVPVLYR
jgi:Flp pilus assembly protein TadG